MSKTYINITFVKIQISLFIIVGYLSTMSNGIFYNPFKQSTVSLVISDVGCHSRGGKFEPQLGQNSFRRLTKVL